MSHPQYMSVLYTQYYNTVFYLSLSIYTHTHTHTHTHTQGHPDGLPQMLWNQTGQDTWEEAAHDGITRYGLINSRASAHEDCRHSEAITCKKSQLCKSRACPPPPPPPHPPGLVFVWSAQCLVLLVNKTNTNHNN